MAVLKWALIGGILGAIMGYAYVFLLSAATKDISAGSAAFMALLSGAVLGAVIGGVYGGFARK